MAVPESARVRGKQSGSKRALGLRLRPLAMACLLAWVAPSAWACDAGDTASLANCVKNIAADPAQTINLTADIILNGNIGVLAGDPLKPITINGNRHTLDGAGTYRGFFLGAGTVTINDLTLQNLRAKGGDGGQDFAMGGGGMGAGGAVFARSGVDLTLNNVSLVSNSAVGGNSNANFTPANPNAIYMASGGGGGLGGAGGGSREGLAANVGQGGGGLYADGSIGSDQTHAGNGGGPYGGAGETFFVVPFGPSTGTPPGPGGDYSGGGGALDVDNSRFGGGGGAGASGGFGGGGGGSFATGGAGGFGGGGGEGVNGGGGQGGFGGGAGSQYNGGGGGAGMGGAVFIQNGARVTLTGSFSVNGNSVTAGVGAYDPFPLAAALRASAFGSGIFLQGSTSALTFAPGSGTTQTVANTIADQTGSGGTGSNAGSIGIIKTGAGTLQLTGANTYSGGTDLQQSRVEVGNDSALGLGVLTMHGGTTLGFIADRLTLGNAISFADTADAFIDTGNFPSFLGGTISGPGNLVKTGTGPLTLAGPNTYVGRTTIVSGVLQAGDGGTSGTLGIGDVSVNSGATVSFRRAPSAPKAMAAWAACKRAPICGAMPPGAQAFTPASSTASSRSRASPAASPTWRWAATTCAASTSAATRPMAPAAASISTPSCNSAAIATKSSRRPRCAPGARPTASARRWRSASPSRLAVAGRSNRRPNWCTRTSSSTTSTSGVRACSRRATATGSPAWAFGSRATSARVQAGCNPLRA
ncbi:hypothetical protein GCM10023165_07160 [Variovorax defluvii]|uniref:Autotransporter-associated beta strand protein n=1 Tax=Variovorax defluvii TaxID=913761 RepID=A0ABP8H078_9BURK